MGCNLGIPVAPWTTLRPAGREERIMPKSVNVLAVVTAFLLLAAACSRGSSSPTSPSGESSSGAVITGSVRSGASLLAVTTGGALPGMSVTVVGTSISSGIDAAGRFALNGVPAGSAQLKFVGPGVDASLTLSGVQSSQNIELVVALTGTSAAVESEVRTGADEQIEGRVESLPPTTAASTFVVAGRTITTDGTTRFEQSGTAKSFSDLQIGIRVHVTGRALGTNVLASRVEIQNTNVDVPAIVNGVIDSLTGTTLAFQFKIAGRVIKGDSLTEFFGDGSTQDSFSNLHDGVRIEVKGQQRDGYVYAARIHVNDGNDDSSDNGSNSQDSSASIHGTVTAMSGAIPNLVLTVGGVTVRTTGTTEVKRRGDVQSLDALRNGQSLHVVGNRQPDGSLIARQIEIDDDATGGEFEIEGALGGLQGTCPSITFNVNGFRVHTSGATTFQGATCTALKSGDKVQVKGTRNADGSVSATSVKRN